MKPMYHILDIILIFTTLLCWKTCKQLSCLAAFQLIIPF